MIEQQHKIKLKLARHERIHKTFGLVFDSILSIVKYLLNVFDR